MAMLVSSLALAYENYTDILILDSRLYVKLRGELEGRELTTTLQTRTSLRSRLGSTECAVLRDKLSNAEYIYSWLSSCSIQRCMRRVYT